MTTLIEIASQYRADVDKLLDTELPDKVVADTLAGMVGDLEEKATNVAAVVLSLDGFSDKLAEAEKRIAARRKTMENRAKNLRAYLLMCMQKANLPKIETPELRLSIRKNPAAVVVDDATEVPAKFWRIPEPPPAEIDKNAIKQAIKDGTEVPGAHLEQAERIHID